MTTATSTRTALLIAVLVSANVGAHAQPANAPSSFIKRSTVDNLDVVPAVRAGSFSLAERGGSPAFVTFNQCHNAAKESCVHGIESLDHEEDTGNCAFSCLAAPSDAAD